MAVNVKISSVIVGDSCQDITFEDGRTFFRIFKRATVVSVCALVCLGQEIVISEWPRYKTLPR